MQEFIQELVFRVKSKSPKFFFILQLFSLVMVGMGKIPWVLDRWMPGVHVNEGFVNFCGDVSKIFVGFWAGTFLPVKGSPAVLTDKGTVLKQLDNKELPFTTRSEIKTVEDLKQKEGENGGGK